MEKKILVEDVRKNETRIAVLKDGVLEDCLVESHDRVSLKGNIYLAKVVRIEPALQAAFMDYGEDQHGFLPFNEIHPDYFRIPVDDREALYESSSYNNDEGEGDDFDGDNDNEEGSSLSLEENMDEVDEDKASASDRDEIKDNSRSVRHRSRRFVNYRKYRIQEVIKKNQVILVQVTKERRVNKGVTLSTYISLASRYSVFMANTTRGGGISRKIGSFKDRQILKNLLQDIDIPEGQGLIVRTAGARLTAEELKKDYERIVTVWEGIRNKTIESIAPKLIHEEAGLSKRLVRDFYDHDVKEVIISGDKFYKEVKEYMGLVVPSHKRRVKKYKGDEPLFYSQGVESDLDSIYEHKVSLISGGHIVLSPTEALVSIDVNSGKATRERSIGETALATNLEAADEIARQLRLRDLSGLIVVDFIDMEAYQDRRKVEERFRQATSMDKARLQIGDISNFGLLEMSRQRLRSSLNELFMERCSHCQGGGYVMSTSVKLRKMLQEIEGYLFKVGKEKTAQLKTVPTLTLMVTRGFAVSFLNSYRRYISELEDIYKVKIMLEEFDSHSGAAWSMELSPDLELLQIRSVNGKKIPKKVAETISKTGYKERVSTRKEVGKPSRRKQVRDRAKSPRGFKAGKNEENIDDLVEEHYKSLEDSVANASGQNNDLVEKEDVTVKKSTRSKKSRVQGGGKKREGKNLKREDQGDASEILDGDVGIVIGVKDSSEESNKEILIEPSDYNPKTKTLRRFIGNRIRVESKGVGDKSGLSDQGVSGSVEDLDRERVDSEDTIEIVIPAGIDSEEQKGVRGKPKGRTARKGKSSGVLKKLFGGADIEEKVDQNSDEDGSKKEIVIDTSLFEVSTKRGLGKTLKSGSKKSNRDLVEDVTDTEDTVETDN